MIKLSSLTLATAVAALLLAGPASAQSTAPAAAAAKSAPAMAAPKAKVAHSAVSMECSKQADAKGLHGKERHKFRAACKKNGGKAM